MWLLDVNVSVEVKEVLTKVGIVSKSAIQLGWRELRNGALVEEAYRRGFRVLVTKDRLFSESASKRLKSYPDFAVIIVSLPQQKATEFAASFRSAWAVEPIQPVPGQTIFWPAAAGS